MAYLLSSVNSDVAQVLQTLPSGRQGPVYAQLLLWLMHCWDVSKTLTAMVLIEFVWNFPISATQRLSSGIINTCWVLVWLVIVKLVRGFGREQVSEWNMRTNLNTSRRLVIWDVIALIMTSFWWCDDTRSQAIRRHGIDLTSLKQSGSPFPNRDWFQIATWKRNYIHHKVWDKLLIRGGVLFLTQAWVLLKWKLTQVHI